MPGVILCYSPHDQEVFITGLCQSLSPIPPVKARFFYPDSTITYSVDFLDSAGCLASDTLYISVSPKPMVLAFGDTLICVGDSISLRAIGTNFVVWSPGVSLSDSTSFSPTAYPSQRTVYLVSGYNESNQCQSIDSVVIEVDPCDCAIARIRNPKPTACIGDSVEVFDNSVLNTAASYFLGILELMPHLPILFYRIPEKYFTTAQG